MTETTDGAGTGDEPPILSERFLESMKAAKAVRDGKPPPTMNLASAEGDAAPDPAEAWAPAFHAWAAENNIETTPTFISITPDLVGFAELTADETERRILEWANDKRPDPTEGATDD